MLDYLYNLDIPTGETRRMDCPNCNGYKTFTVTNNMGALLWNCYKVSCSISGKKRVHLSIDDIKHTFNVNTLYNKTEAFILPEYVVDRKNYEDTLKMYVFLN